MVVFLIFAHAINARIPAITTDSIENYLQEQLIAFPQEKIHVQTDKPSYLSGERMWFRAHKVDALTHQPIFLSRYIYVEVITPLDDLVKRVKIRPDSTGAYSGYIDLDEDLVEGIYTLRAYTKYMQNMGEDFYFKKTIQVLDPFSLEIEPQVTFNIEDNDIHATIQLIDRQSKATILPEVVTYKIEHGNLKTLKPKDNNTYEFNTRLTGKEANRILLLSLVHNGRKYNRYYTIPPDESRYNVQLFPEGGFLIPGVTSLVAFKALNSDGLSTPVTGSLFDSTGKEILTFKSAHLGMGFFHFIPTADTSYHVICKNRHGVEKRFDLPAAQGQADIITARIVGERLMIQHHRGSKSSQGPLSLLIHHKGLAILHKELNPGVGTLNISTSMLPSGIINILLLNGKREVLSERLIFNLHESDIASMQASTAKPSYNRREKISISLNMDESEKVSDSSLSSFAGNIAVSITDQNAVIPDSTVDIISTMLLSSELKGYIESPASYFSGGKMNKNALDALMLTQGWKRYNIPGVLQGEIFEPDMFTPELTQKITGKSENLFGGLKEGQVSLMAKLDTLTSTEATQADDDGHFSFNVEYPEGTTILVQSRSKRGGTTNVINLDKETFPPLPGAGITLKTDAMNLASSYQDSYLKQANEEYSQQFGLRTIFLEEVTITAQSIDRYRESSFYSPIHAMGVQTSEDIEKMSVTSLRSLLFRQPGIVIRGDIVTTTRSQMPVLFVIDDLKYEDFSGRLDDIDVSSIESLFVLRDNTSMPGYFPNTSGAIVITTKLGNFQVAANRAPSIDEIIPLGYQEAAEFYSPVYETAMQIDSSTPDHRTTIYWKPNVELSDKGEAVIEFYSADYTTTYQLIAEGVNDNGKIVHIKKEITIAGSSN